MDFSSLTFAPAAAEIFVLTAACVILLVDLFVTDRRITLVLTLLTLLGAFLVTALTVDDGRVLTFNGMFVSDGLANVLKLFTYVIVAVVFIYSRDYLKDRDLFRGEYLILGLFATLGMMVMISAHSFLTIYLGLELLSLSTYAMVAFDRNSAVASEAAMKYFVLGAIASGALLYGISILYGLTGTLDLGELALHLDGQGQASVAMLFALAFVLVGLAFKLGAVPFHMWLPDVYHGAPTSVTLFIATAPKISAFAIVMRVLAEGMGGLHAEWQDMLIVLSVLSMAVGNIVAIAQSNLKRMLAYSTISHVGFILLGFIAGGAVGYRAAMFYTLAYAVMTSAAFGLLLLMARAGHESDALDDLKGLNARNAWFAGLMLIVMFSMAGVPVFVGFHAKWIVLSAVIDAGLTWLALAGVVFSVIGAFYYLRVIKLMYFDEPEADFALQSAPDMRLVLSANGLAVLGLGLFPQLLLALCVRAIA